MNLSIRSKFALNPLEEDDFIAEELRRKGKTIIALSRGDPPNYFPTPEYIINAYIKALKERQTHYAAAPGVFELRDAVARRYITISGARPSLSARATNRSRCSSASGISCNAA